MLPLRDSNKTHSFPLVTYALIALNIYFFFIEMSASDLDQFLSQYALVPAQVNFSSPETLKPFITSQFLHVGLLHLISNMWFLRIFGDNVEEAVGKIKYLFVYLLSGVVGGLLQYFFMPGSDIPMLGASGAVAGVLGAYFVFFPRHKIETLIPLGFFLTTIDLPASIMLIYWFVTQLFSGVGSFASADMGGVAFWAHIGGFAAGYLAAKFSSNRNTLKYEGVEEIQF